MATLKDTLIQGSARVTDTLYTKDIKTETLTATGTTTVKTLTLSSTDMEGQLNFSRSGNWNYILFPSAASSVLAISQATGAANGLLVLDGSSVSSPKKNSLGNNTYPWGSLYGSGVNYLYSGNSRYPLDIYLYNNSKNKVAEIWYDTGDATNVTSGKYYFRQYSPNSTANTTTTGKREDYRLPTVATGLTEDKNYDIITTKNLSSITSVGTITSGTWQGTAIASSYIGSHNHNASNINDGILGVARGGTGAGTFTADCIIVGNGTNAMASRGLKVSGATDANVTIQPNTSGKTLTIQTAGNANLTLSSSYSLFLNKTINTSIIFTSGGADTSHENARFNTNGMLQLNSAVTQSTHRLLVNGDSAFYGKIAFTAAPANTMTEKMYMQYDTTTDILNFVFA